MGGAGVTQSEDLFKAPGAARRRAAQGAVSEPLHDQPRQRRRLRTQYGELHLRATLEHLIDERVKHCGLVLQDLGKRQHVVLGAGMDLTQSWDDAMPDPP